MMEIDELVERLEAIESILVDMDNAATPDLIEAIKMVKNIITGRQVKLEKQLNESLSDFNLAFESVLDQFLLQLFKESKNNKKFKR